MGSIDIRNEEVGEVTEIVFANSADHSHCTQASKVAKWPFAPGQVVIKDSDYDAQALTGYVVVSSKDHANHLIKALKKAIELGWLK